MIPLDIQVLFYSRAVRHKIRLYLLILVICLFSISLSNLKSMDLSIHVQAFYFLKIYFVYLNMLNLSVSAGTGQWGMRGTGKKDPRLARALVL